MKHLVIIGAGGMGRTLFDMIRESHGYMDEYDIKGYIDSNLNALNGFRNYPPILGSVLDYIPQHEDVFVCSIGGEMRCKCMKSIIMKGGIFINIIHKTARVGTNVELGRGNFIGAFTTIAADAKLGNYNFIQSHVIVGHDVKIGDWNRIDSYVMCVGGIEIRNEVMIHTAAVLNHNIEIGDGARGGACSFVTRDVDAGTTVYGNPARRLC